MEVLVYRGEPVELINIITVVNEAVVTRRYAEPGTISLLIPVRDDSRIKPNDMLYVKVSEEGYIAESVTILTLNGVMCELVIGRTMSSLLARRVTSIPVTFVGTTGSVIRKMLMSVFSAVPRRFEGFVVNINTNLGEERTYQPRVGPLLADIMELCAASSLGFRSVFDMSTKLVTFEIYEGSDWTADDIITLSVNYGNIISSKYTFDLLGGPTIAYMTGGVNPHNNITARTLVGATAGQGLNRYETALLYSGDYINEDNSVMSAIDYVIMMASYGSDYLTRRKANAVITCELQGGAASVGNVGDIVFCDDPLAQTKIRARITEIATRVKGGEARTSVTLREV